MKKYWIIGMILAILAVPGWAEETKTATVTLDVSKMEISAVCRQIEKQAEVKILVDSAISGTITANLSGVTVDKALELICRGKNVRIQKAYVSASQINGMSASSLRDALDSLRALEGTGYALVTTDSEGKSATVFAKGLAMDSVKSGIMAKGADYKLVYLLTPQKDAASSSNSVKGGNPADFAAADKARMDAIAQLTPEQQRQAFFNSFRNAMNGSGVSQDAMLDALRQFIRALPERQRGKVVSYGFNPTVMPRPNPDNGPGVGIPGGPGSPGGPGGGGPGTGNPGGPGTPTTPPPGDDMPPPPPL